MQKSADRSGGLQQNARAVILKGSLIFSSLKDRELTELAKCALERRFTSGEYIFWEGDTADWFYVIAEGRIKVIKHASTGKDFIVAFFGEGEMFGEVAVFENKQYPASAQAVTEVKVLGIKKKSGSFFLVAKRGTGGFVNLSFTQVKFDS